MRQLKQLLGYLGPYRRDHGDRRAAGAGGDLF